jgi:hypothetical protein
MMCLYVIDFRSRSSPSFPVPLLPVLARRARLAPISSSWRAYSTTDAAAKVGGMIDGEEELRELIAQDLIETVCVVFPDHLGRYV